MKNKIEAHKAKRLAASASKQVHQSTKIDSDSSARKQGKQTDKPSFAFSPVEMGFLSDLGLSDNELDPLPMSREVEETQSSMKMGGKVKSKNVEVISSKLV